MTIALASSAAADEGFKSGVFDPPRLAPDFELPASNGATLTMGKLRGKVVIVEFGFTYCPRICPVTLANLSEVWKRLGPAAAEVQLVFVTVDPKRDTPDRLREFLQFFNPAFLGVTGKEKELGALRDAYGVIATKAVSENKKLGYEVHHSSSIYLVDREGKLRTLVPFGMSPEAIAHDLKLLLKK
jgi:protein SCO1/2